MGQGATKVLTLTYTVKITDLIKESSPEKLILVPEADTKKVRISLFCPGDWEDTGDYIPWNFDDDQALLFLCPDLLTENKKWVAISEGRSSKNFIPQDELLSYLESIANKEKCSSITILYSEPIDVKPFLTAIAVNRDDLYDLNSLYPSHTVLVTTATDTLRDMSKDYYRQFKLLRLEDRYEAKKTDVVINDRPAEHYTLYGDGQEMGVRDFVNRLTDHENFREFLTLTLKKSYLMSFFFECSPISRKLYKQNAPFSFYLIDAPELENVIPDNRAFDMYEKCDDETGAISTVSKSKDAVLVIPCPRMIDDENSADYGDDRWYGTLRQFVDNSDAFSYDSLWYTVGKKLVSLLKKYRKRTLYLNTHGTAVPWLHIRIDSKPKYYISNV